MGQIVYGPGALWLKRIDIANATPINVGKVNEFSFDEDGDAKALHGQTDYPLAVRRGTVKLSGKAKTALLSAQAMNCFNGNIILAGTQVLASLAETATVPVAPPFTVTAANAATFDEDLGPLYAANQAPFSNTATLTGAGQYQVSGTGTYTFDSVDSGVAVALNYSYKDTTHGGFMKTTIGRSIGTMPVFELIYATSDAVGGAYYVRFFNCISTKLAKSFKLVDFMMPEIDFMMAQNQAGQVYEESFSPAGV
jgi:hypothetical protein